MATLQTFRRDAASRLGLLDVFETTGVGTGPDAETSVIVEQFAGAQASTLYENAYVYPTDGAQAGVQRPTRQNGLSVSATTLRVSWPWPAPLELGTEVEVLRLVPAVTELGRQGWREIINSVLHDIPTIRRYPITATGAVRYDVPVWLEAEDQAIGIYDPESTGANAVLSQNLKSIRYDGEVVMIELWTGYSAGSIFSLAAYQPTSTRIKTASGWDDAADGLVDDADEALAHRTLVRAMAIQRAAEMELERPDPRSKAMWQRTLSEWTPIAAGLKARLVPARHTIMTVGTSGGSGWPKGLFG